MDMVDEVERIFEIQRRGLTEGAISLTFPWKIIFIRAGGGGGECTGG